MAGKVASSIEEAELDLFREWYEVPQDIHFWVPTLAERADQPPAGCVAINQGAMDACLCFSLHPRVSEILNRWDVALIQITPNGWSTLIGLLTVFVSIQPGHLPEVDEILSLTNIVDAHAEGSGWYYVRAHPHNKIVEDVPNKVEEWKSRFWWVSGDWQSPVEESGRGGRIHIRTEFGFAQSKSRYFFTFPWTEFDFAFFLQLNIRRSRSSRTS